MKITKTIFILTILCIAQFGSSQKVFRNVIEISTNVGFSSDLAPLHTISSFSSPEDIIMEQRSPARVRSFALSLGGYLTKRSGFKVTAGQLEFGYDYKGRLETSNTPISDSYRVTYLDFGIVLMHRIPISESLKILVNSGFHFNTDGSPRSGTINYGNRNSYSASGYVGAEIPMFGNHFFINGGLQVKYPLKQYNRDRGSGIQYLPYFIGIKIGVNYQF